MNLRFLSIDRAQETLETTAVIIETMSKMAEQMTHMLQLMQEMQRDYLKYYGMETASVNDAAE